MLGNMTNFEASSRAFFHPLTTFLSAI